MGFDDPIFGDPRGGVEDRVGHAFRGRATVRHVELEAEILFQPTRIVTGRHDEAAIGPVQPDEVARRRGGEQRILPDDHLRRAVGGTHTQDHLRHLRREIAPVAAEHEGLALGTTDRVDGRLHEVLHEVSLHEDAGFLAQPRGAGLLPFDGLCRDGADCHGLPSMVAASGWAKRTTDCSAAL